MSGRRPLYKFLPHVLTALLIFVLTAAALAQENLPNLFPALRSLPAPSWVKEGTRLSYSAISATVGGGSDTPGVSGETVMQVDVVALEQDKAILQTRMFVRSSDGLHPYPAVGTIGMASCAGEWWANPAVFQGKLPDIPAGGPTMAKMPYTLGNKTYDGIRIEYKTDKGSGVWVFDLKTGILLFMSSSIPTADARNQQSSMSLLGVRTMPLPWIGLQPNPLTATIKGFEARGEYDVSVVGGMPTTMSVSIRADVGQRGSRWIGYSQTSTMGSAVQTPAFPETSFATCGPGQMGGLLLPAKAAANLAPGRTLDTDNVTGARFFVAENGPQGIVLCEELPVASTWWYYNPEGFCSRLVIESRGLVAVRADITIQGM